jgi:hypothetical protein
MPNPWDGYEFDDDDGEEAETAAELGETGEAGDPPARDEPAELAEQRALLVSAVESAAGQPLRLALAQEALVSHDERGERARRASVAAAAALAVDGGGALDSAEIQDGLRFRVLADREAASSAYLARRSTQFAAEYGAETAAQMVAHEAEANAAVDAWLAGSGDPLMHSAAYVAEARAIREEARAREFARQRLQGSIVEDAELAQAGITELLERTLAGGRS